MKFLFVVFSTLIYKSIGTAWEAPYCTDETSNFSMDLIDRYLLLIFAPIAFLCTVFITSTFLFFPKTRRMPGDIIFCISLCECILSMHWFISALYDVQHDEAPDQNSGFCQTNAFFSVMAGTGEFIYNFAFCVYLRVTLTQVLKVNLKIRLMLHFVSLIIVVGVPSFSFSIDLLGLSLAGTCSFAQKNSFPYAGFALLVTYLTFSIYTIMFFKGAVPNTEALISQKKSFMRYYFNYILASSIIWTVLAISNFMMYLNCAKLHLPLLNIFVTICTMAKVATPIVLSIMRYYDPSIRNKLIKLFYKVFTKRRTQTGSSIESENWLEKIASNIKFLQVMSILSGVRQAYIDPMRNMTNLSQLQADTSEISSNLKEGQIQNDCSNLRARIISIDPEVSDFLRQVHNFGENELNEKITSKIEGGTEQLPMKMTIYAPQVFRALIENDSKMVDPIESLDPHKNKHRILEFKNPDGGKSGEFFFFTEDNSLILKTMTDAELAALLRRLPNYLHHVTKYETMISIIYGIFSFERLDSHGHPKIHVLMMRNIAQCPSKYRIRTYDMKGSDYDREVITKKKVKPDDINKVTLKDTDFFNLEQKININLELTDVIREQLLKDAEFFQQMKLMDYSLLVMKINWKSYLADNPNTTMNQIKAKFQRKQCIIPSVVEEGVYYHIAIIDYLQEWNHQKQREQITKKIINANSQLGLSAIEPHTYAERFKDKLVKQIL